MLVATPLAWDFHNWLELHSATPPPSCWYVVSKFTWLWEEVRIIRRRTIKSHVSFLYIYCTRSLVYIHVQRTRGDLEKSVVITNLLSIIWGGYSVLYKVKSIIQWAGRQGPIFRSADGWVSPNCNVVLQCREISSKVSISARLWIECFECQP